MRLIVAGVIAALPGLVFADPVAGVLTEWQSATCVVVGGCQGERCSVPPADYELVMERDADRERDDWRILKMMELDFESETWIRDYYVRPFASKENARDVTPIRDLETRVLHVIYPVETSTAQQIFEVVANKDDPESRRFRLICSEGRL